MTGRLLTGVDPSPARAKGLVASPAGWCDSTACAALGTWAAQRPAWHCLSPGMTSYPPRAKPLRRCAALRVRRTSAPCSARELHRQLNLQKMASCEATQAVGHLMIQTPLGYAAATVLSIPSLYVCWCKASFAWCGSSVDRFPWQPHVFVPRWAGVYGITCFWQHLQPALTLSP